MSQIQVTNLADGLGYGEGTITSSRNDLTVQLKEEVEAVINSSEILVPIDKDASGEQLDDDGCGDGRGVSRIWEGTAERARSLNRAKVFGGGATMATAALIGLGEAKDTLRATFSAAIAQLKERGIAFGAHTDSHAHGDSCGCGAIDKAPQIVANAMRFEEQIRDSIAALGIEATDDLPAVFEGYKALASKMEDDYTGTSVKDEIQQDGRVIKELADDHLEAFVVLNQIPGYTVNQEAVRQATGGKVQVFGVDVWRMSELANRLYPEDANKQHQAFLSELVYTLATAATLTRGDLPVRVLTEKQAITA